MSIKSIISSMTAVAIGVFFCSPMMVRAEDSLPQAPEIVGESAVVMDVDSGTVLYEKNAHEQLYPASITKIMTTLLALENSTMDENVTFSYDSVHKTEGSSIWRDVDEVMTMEECIYAMMLNSANECAYAVAEYVGGSYENFIQMMNDRAQALGCSDTHFSNPHGLTEEDHYTSSYDMALIAREAIKNETFRQITGTKRYEIPPTNKHPDEITYLTNHHKMLWENEEYYEEYCIGGKTGYTLAAGNTLATFAEKDGITLVCVVLQDKMPNHYVDTIALLDFCFDNFQSFHIAENPEDTEVLQQTETSAGGASYDRQEEAVEVEESGANVAEVRQFEMYTDNLITILLVVLGIVVLASLAFGFYMLKGNFFLLRYKFYSRRGQNPGESVLKRKRRRRGK